MQALMSAGVLVVDDDEDIRTNLVSILRLQGHQVDEASNGREALGRLQRDRPPGLLILDLMMPVMNGWELRSQMRAHPAFEHIPTIVMTGAGQLGAADLEALAPAAMLAKPFDLLELLTLISRYLPPPTPEPVA